jgi:hypothetical protein
VSQPKSIPETVRQPRSIAAKFVTWLVIFGGPYVIVDALYGGIEFPLQRDSIYPLLAAAVVAYFRRPESRGVKFSDKDAFIETLKTVLHQGYDLTIKTQTLLYFVPRSHLTSFFYDIVLIEMRGDIASISGEFVTVRHLRKHLAKVGAAILL